VIGASPGHASNDRRQTVVESSFRGARDSRTELVSDGRNTRAPPRWMGKRVYVVMGERWEPARASAGCGTGFLVRCLDWRDRCREAWRNRRTEWRTTLPSIRSRVDESQSGEYHIARRVEIELMNATNPSWSAPIAVTQIAGATSRRNRIRYPGSFLNWNMKLQERGTRRGSELSDFREKSWYEHSRRALGKEILREKQTAPNS